MAEAEMIETAAKGTLCATAESDQDDALKVLEGVTLTGDINTTTDELLANIRHSIRLGHPQVKPQAPQKDRVCLVGGGPSLESTFDELRDLYFAGAKVVTVNGAYAWCLERNIRPSAQIVLDARAFNVKFVVPPIPNCRYLLASQCHPDSWAAVADRDTWIWHAIGPENELRDELDTYYQKSWHGITGGTTVVMRAISLLRTLGYLRMDLFGVDSCWMDKKHHAYAQEENQDRCIRLSAHPSGHPELARTFICAPWHVKQLEDFLQTVRVNGQHFMLNIHGDGLLAFALQANADLKINGDGLVANTVTKGD